MDYPHSILLASIPNGARHQFVSRQSFLGSLEARGQFECSGNIPPPHVLWAPARF